VNYRSYSVYESSQYGINDGYATKNEAIDAAVVHVSSEIKNIASTIDYKAQQMMDYIGERKKLEGMRDEAATDSTT
jgi:hypothetical protein